jgi:hypothetical protein
MYTIVMIVSLLSVVTYISIGTEIYQDIWWKHLRSTLILNSSP